MSLIIQIRQSNNQRQIFLFACFINIVQQILLLGNIIEIDFNFAILGCSLCGLKFYFILSISYVSLDLIQMSRETRYTY